jgi:AcrR family transcriptional regulator
MVAERSGGTPSTIIYRYGSKEALITAALEVARCRDRAWREAALDALPAPTLEPTMFSGFLHAVVHADGADHRTLSRVRWECFLGTEFTGNHHALTTAWSSDHEEFWRNALDVFSIDTDNALLVAEFADALVRLYLGTGSLLAYMAWAGEASSRFAARLLRCEVEPQAKGAWRRAHLIDDLARSGGSYDPDMPDVVQRIIDTAARMVVQSGPQALTHRAVASAAGVSLSSTTYHFTSRAEILRAACKQLYRAWVLRSGPPTLPTANHLSSNQVIERMLVAMFPEPGVVAPEQLAQQMVQLQASGDAELQRELDDMRAAAGPATTALLKRIDGLDEAVDDLDGFCFATWVTGLARSTRLTQGSDCEAYMRERYKDGLQRLFGV